MVVHFQWFSVSIIFCGGGGVGGSHNNVAILHNHIPLK